LIFKKTQGIAAGIPEVLYQGGPVLCRRIYNLSVDEIITKKRTFGGCFFLLIFFMLLNYDRVTGELSVSF
jgi:hypothetical protein